MDLSEKSILIIEDTESQRLLLTSILQEIGVGTVLTARDGLEGIRAARYYKPDLVLLDIGLPKVDGFEVCRKIRLFANKMILPIIVITGLEKSESLEDIFELGANDYFEKPFSNEEIKHRISFYLEYCDMFQKLGELERYLHQDIRVAKSVQHNTLPPLESAVSRLSSLGIDFHVYVDETNLGGDSWGVRYLDSGEPVFFLFDVTGHGINAAINNSFITSFANSVFQEFKSKSASNFDPAQFLQKLNHIIYDNSETETFCSAACFVVCGNFLKYSGCGLPEIKALNVYEGIHETWSCKGLPLGVTLESFSPTNGVIQDLEHKTVLAMTDGLIESLPDVVLSDTNTDQDLYEYGLLPGDMLLNSILKNMSKDKNLSSSEDFLQSILNDFSGRQFNLTSDDITMLAIRKQ